MIWILCYQLDLVLPSWIKLIRFYWPQTHDSLVILSDNSRIVFRVFSSSTPRESRDTDIPFPDSSVAYIATGNYLRSIIWIDYQFLIGFYVHNYTTFGTKLPRV